MPIAALVEDYFGIRGMMDGEALARLMREAARAAGFGDGMGNYLIERAIDEITSQQWQALDPFSEDWPTKQNPTR